MLYVYNMSREEDLDVVFRALGDARRRQMLDLLKDRPRTTGEVCERFSTLDRCTVMQHLGVLERAGLIVIRREGRNRWNYFNPLPIKQLHDRWVGAYAASAAGILARLKVEMERQPSGPPPRPAANRRSVPQKGGVRT